MFESIHSVYTISPCWLLLGCRRLVHLRFLGGGIGLFLARAARPAGFSSNSALSSTCEYFAELYFDMFISKYILKKENKQLIDVNLNGKVTFFAIALTFPMFSDVPKFFLKKGQSKTDKTGVWHLIYGRI